jgi:hypothetical protein
MKVMKFLKGKTQDQTETAPQYEEREVLEGGEPRSKQQRLLTMKRMKLLKETLILNRVRDIGCCTLHVLHGKSA